MASLTTRILNSLVWVLSNVVVANGITFVRTMVLWRFLQASDFGLNATIWMVIQSLSFLQDMGFSQALVQRRTDVEAAAAVTWYANFFINLALYVFFFVLAPVIATHFEAPELELLIRVASLTLLVRGVGTTSFALLRREFRFKTILWVNTSELVLATSAQIALAVNGFGVWGLVWGHLAGVALRAALLIKVRPIRLGKPDLQVGREMFRFGKHVTLSALFLWLIKNMDNYFVGKHLGMVALGFYSLAYRLSHLISSQVMRMLGAVLFPAFSEIGNDYGRARNAWLKASRYCMILITPMAVGLMVFAPEIILGFYPQKCGIAVIPTIVLTFFALCRGFGTTLGDLARGVGKPELVSRAASIHMCIMAPALYLAVHAVDGLTALGATMFEPGSPTTLWFTALLAASSLQISLVAVSAAVSGTAIFAIAWTFYECSRETGLTVSTAFRAVVPALGAGGVMVVAAGLAKAAVYSFSGGRLVALFLAGPLSLVVYAACIWFFYPDVVRELRSILQKRKTDARKKNEAKAAAEENERNAAKVPAEVR